MNNGYKELNDAIVYQAFDDLKHSLEIYTGRRKGSKEKAAYVIADVFCYFTFSGYEKHLARDLDNPLRICKNICYLYGVSDINLKLYKEYEITKDSTEYNKEIKRLEK